MTRPIIRSIRRPIIRSIIGGIGGYADPVPGWLLRYAMDGNDSSLVPINSPSIVTGLDLPDRGATEFNGVDQFYTANADSATVATIGDGPFTITFRIKTSIASARTIMEFGDPDLSSGFKVNTRGVGGLTLKVDGTSLNLLDDRFLDGIWLHVAITGTGSGGTLEFFVNGVANPTTRTLPVYNLTDTNDFMIADTNLPAAVDEIRLYNSVRSQSDITALSNNT